MGRTVDQRTGVADVLSSTAESGEVRVKLGHYESETGIDPSAPMWGLGGFISRPVNPDDDGAALAFYLQDGNRRYVLATRDVRAAERCGSLDPGDSAIVVPGGEARLLVKEARDAVVAYTVNQKDDMSMLFDMSGVDGEITLLNNKSFIKMKGDEVSIGVMGGATLRIKGDGTVQIDGAQCNIMTGRGQLGALAPGTPQAAPAFSILYGPNGMAGVPSGNWTIVP